jgi:hypothetical protein
MTDYTITDLIAFSSQQRPAEFEAAFNNVIASRLETAINDKKIEVAQRMFNRVDQEEIDIEDTEDGEIT